MPGVRLVMAREGFHLGFLGCVVVNLPTRKRKRKIRCKNSSAMGLRPRTTRKVRPKLSRTTAIPLSTKYNATGKILS